MNITFSHSFLLQPGQSEMLVLPYVLFAFNTFKGSVKAINFLSFVLLNVLLKTMYVFFTLFVGISDILKSSGSKLFYWNYIY